jgi:hypothetical protein
MPDHAPLATHDYQPGRLDAALEFLKRTRSELRTLRKVRVYRDRLEVIDVNGDRFEVRGLGWPDADVVPILDAVNTAYKRETIHAPVDADYKEFNTGRRYAWAADRVM